MKKLEKYQYEIITVIGSVFLGAWWAFDYPNSPILFFVEFFKTIQLVYFFLTKIFNFTKTFSVSLNEESGSVAFFTFSMDFHLRLYDGIAKASKLRQPTQEL